MSELVKKMENFVSRVGVVESEHNSAINTKQGLEMKIQELIKHKKLHEDELDMCTKAIELLRAVSDEVVAKAYREIETNINAALERMFKNSVKKIKIEEYTRAGQYPQLELVLIGEGGSRKSLKSDSGHGVAQIVSFLVLLCLISRTQARRLLVLDEVLSGISENNLKIIADIMWAFTNIGFQFIVNEQGFIPRGAKVYELLNVAGVSRIERSYVSQDGLYLSDTDNFVDTVEDSMEDYTQREESPVEFNGGVLSI